MDVSGFAAMIDHVATTYPNFQVIATQRDGLEILDRVGGGDSFASGLIAALLEGQDLTTAVGVGRRARRACHDHPRRHVHGHQGRSPQARVRRRSPRRPMSGAWDAPRSEVTLSWNYTIETTSLPHAGS